MRELGYIDNDCLNSLFIGFRLKIIMIRLMSSINGHHSQVYSNSQCRLRLTQLLVFLSSVDGFNHSKVYTMLFPIKKKTMFIDAFMIRIINFLL